MQRPTRTVVQVFLLVATGALGLSLARADEADAGLDGAVDADVVEPAPQKPAAAPVFEGPALPPGPSFAIQIGERRLCELRLDRGGEKADARARRASRALDVAMEDGHPGDIRVTFDASTAVLYVGNAPFVQLDGADANADGDASVTVLAEACAASVRDGMRTELRRRNIANLVFSISLIVLSGLLSFLLLGVVSRAADRVSALVEAREDVPALKIGTIEILTPAAVRVGTSTAISVGKPVVQIVIAFGWLLSSMSLLPLTAALGRRLTGYVLVPLTTFLGRIGAALPLLVLVALGAFALAILLRFLRVFFESVAQGGIHLGWLEPKRAVPVSVALRAFVILGALLAAAPLLTGDTAEWGALRIAGVALAFAFTLAITPSLANAAIGTYALFSGRFTLETLVEVGTHAGRLVRITITELVLVDRAGIEIRVHHLQTLLHAVRVLGDSIPSHYEIVVDARAPQGPIRKALVDALRRQGRAAHVELTEIEGARAVYRVEGTAAEGEEDLASALADALTREGVAFTRIRKLDDR